MNQIAASPFSMSAGVLVYTDAMGGILSIHPTPLRAHEMPSQQIEWHLSVRMYGSRAGVQRG